jgi:histidyl-tRNA synthetase
MLDQDGQVVFLPMDGLFPFARYVCRNQVPVLRRYSLDRIYLRNPAGGQPLQQMEANFDMVFRTPSDSMVFV